MRVLSCVSRGWCAAVTPVIGWLVSQNKQTVTNYSRNQIYTYKCEDMSRFKFYNFLMNYKVIGRKNTVHKNHGEIFELFTTILLLRYVWFWFTITSHHCVIGMALAPAAQLLKYFTFRITFSFKMLCNFMLFKTTSFGFI